MPQPASIHASAVLVGARAVLIRGASGAGKSRLALALIESAGGASRLTRLVADDRALVEAANGRLLVRPVAAIAGLLEVRGLGIRRLPFEPLAQVGLVIDLGASDAERVPSPATRSVMVAGIELPRLGIAAAVDPLPLVLSYLHTTPAGMDRRGESEP